MIDKLLTEENTKKINKELLESLQRYKTTLAYMAGDAPLEVLCLPKAIQTVLISNGCLRIYDLFDCDFAKIKGLGKTRIRDLTSRLNEFLSIS